MRKLTRRDFLHAGAVGAAGLTLGFDGRSTIARADEPAGVPIPTSKRKRSLRLAHLTDVHVQPELDAAKGLAACLHHVQNQKDKPDLILNGGDTIMDCMARDRARTKLQWDLWKNVIRADCSLPIESCIGNHDVWGWIKDKSHCSGNEDLFGKKWVLDVHGYKSPYRSFDRAGWHFVVLDSVHPHEQGYIGRLDDAQFDWLEKDLKAVNPKTPIVVLSHIPILSVSVFFDGKPDESGKEWRINGATMHIDSRRIQSLFLKHPNVKACLSGHLHLVDRAEYNGVTYLCDGAVSGNWWKGIRHQCREGYALVDLYDDGTVEREYVPYGWVAKKD